MAGENRITVYDEALLRFAIETTEGTAAAMTAASVLYVEGLKENIGEGDSETIDAVTPDRFDQPERRSNMRSSFDFTLPWMYSGTRGTPSALAPVFRVCGGNLIVDQDLNQVRYERARPSAIDSATVEMLGDFAEDGAGNQTAYRYAALGCRGQMGFDWVANKTPRFIISNLIGSYLRPSQVAFVEPDYGNQKTNLGDMMDLGSLHARTLNGKDICLASAKVDNFFGYTMSRPADQICRTTVAQTVQPTLTLVYALPDLQNHFNPWEYAESLAQVRRLPFEVGLGTQDGKRIRAEFGALQPGKPERQKGAGGNTQISQTFKILEKPVLIEE